MDPELRRALEEVRTHIEEVHATVEKNHRILRRIVRSLWLSRLLRVALLALVAAMAWWAYHALAPLLAEHLARIREILPLLEQMRSLQGVL